MLPGRWCLATGATDISASISGGHDKINNSLRHNFEEN